MLQALRDKSSGWIATVILGMLVVPFAFLGVNDYITRSNDTFVAKIEAPPSWWTSAPDWWVVRKLVWQSEEISANDFQQALNNLRERERESAGENFDPREFDSLDNKKRLLDSLVDARVIEMLAKSEGLVVGDAQVKAAIEAVPAFQVDGKFDLQTYLRTIKLQGQTGAQVDALVRKDLEGRLLPTRLQSSAFITPSEAERLLLMWREKRDVSYALLSPAAPDPAATVAPADILKWYKDHNSEFRAPEMVTIEYIDVDGSALPPSAPADEATLRRSYEQDMKRFVDPEQRLASHILVKVDATADAAAQKAAEAKIRKLLAEARGGADFATLARQNSEDEGSKATGGDLGWIARNGAMVKPFEDGVFATAAGSISEPVKSTFGWHIIQVREIRPGHQKPFEEVRVQLEQEYAESARQRAFNDLAGKLTDEVLKSPTSLATAAKSANLTVQKLGPFARGRGTGIAANPAVQRVVFSNQAKQSRLASDPIDIGENRSVFVRVIDYTPSQVPPLSKIGAQVKAAVLADRARKALKADADAILARVNKGESLEAVAKERGLIAANVPGVTRNMPVPAPEAAKAYFEVPAPAAGKVSTGTAQLEDGRMVVFAVSGIVAGKPEDIPQNERLSFANQLSSFIAGEDVKALVARQRKRMHVQQFDDRL